MRFKANSSIARIWASFHSAGTFVMYNKSNFSPAAGIVYHPYLKGRAGRFFGPCRHNSRDAGGEDRGYDHVPRLRKEHMPRLFLLEE